MTDSTRATGQGFSAAAALRLLQTYAVAVMILVLMVLLSLSSDSFLTVQNLINILNQNTPLAIMAAAPRPNVNFLSVINSLPLVSLL